MSKAVKDVCRYHTVCITQRRGNVWCSVLHPLHYALSFLPG